jgi:uncharacterized protein with FMN-binding domain
VAPTNDNSGKKRVKTSLVALSSAAVLAVYGAGYARTRAAAERFAEEPVRRRPAVPAVIQAATPVASTGPAIPAAPTPATTSTRATGAPSVSTSAPANRVSTETVNKAAVEPSAASTAEPSTPPLPAAPAPIADSAPTPSLASVAAMPLAVGTIPASDHTAALAPPPPASQYKDGTYKGWGTSRHGDIEATVIISAGRILSAKISGCYTRYSCSVIDPIPPQVAVRQSPEVDYVSGATQSTNAFYYAVIEALSKAK